MEGSIFNVIRKVLAGLNANDTIVIQSAFLELTDNLVDAAVLSRLVYECGRSEDGTFLAKSAYWQTRYGISDATRRSAVTRLEKLGVGLEAQKWNAGGIQYSFDWAKLVIVLMKHYGNVDERYPGIDSKESAESILELVQNAPIYSDLISDLFAASGRGSGIDDDPQESPDDEKPGRDKVAKDKPRDPLNVVLGELWGIASDEKPSKAENIQINKIKAAVYQAFGKDIDPKQVQAALHAWKRENPRLDYPRVDHKVLAAVRAHMTSPDRPKVEFGAVEAADRVPHEGQNAIPQPRRRVQ